MLVNNPTIELVCVIDRDVEKELHKKFDKQQFRGEWFALSDTDIEYVKSQFETN